jgi:hypothetical protein
MKNFISLFVLMFALAFSSSAAFSELNISISDNASFFVNLDGTEYSASAGSVTIRGLNHGNHYLEVTRETMTLNGVSYNRLFSGYISISPSKRIFAVIDRFGTYKVVRTENISSGYSSNYNSYGSNYGNSYSNVNGHGNGYNALCSNSYGSSSWGNSGYNSGYMPPVSNYMPMGMNPQAFSTLVASMNHEVFDDSKVRIAALAISMNGVTSAQLRELIMLLTFDSNKVKLAKLGYPSVVDKNNIFMLNDAFVFSSSADEFYRSIGIW